jgi:eukaryotic-like serine/threonine-protein kinase
VQYHMLGYALLGEPAKVRKILSETAGREDEFTVTQTMALIQQHAGQYRAASGSLQRGIDQAGRAKAPDVQAGMLLLDAAGRALAGECDGNEALVTRAIGLDKGKPTLESAALAAALCGNGKLALPMAEELSRKNPEDTIIQNVILPLSRAFVSLAAGQPQDAIKAAVPALPYSTIYPSSYVQGLAYLQLHDPQNAVSAFKDASQHRGSSLLGGWSPFYGQAQLGLARAYAMAGNKAEAKKAYEALFVTWKNADADLPPLVAAKKEYAAL